MLPIHSLRDPEDVRTLSVQVIQHDSVARVVLRGEADISTLERLDAALDLVKLHRTRALQLQMSELTFADAATIRRLTLFASHARQTGRRIETCGANPTLRTVARLLNVQDELGLAEHPALECH
jgi:anti-anti-sigma regulatory factor